MKRLGEILLDRGATSVDELQTALEACHRHRSRLGTQLVRYGFVSEQQLLDALSEQTGRPPVPGEILEAATLDVMGLLPVKAARRLGAVPFAHLNREIHVAMLNPLDEVAIEEVRALTGMNVEAFIGTEGAMARAFQRLAGPGEEDDEPVGEIDAVQPARSRWNDVWKGIPPTVDDLMALSDPGQEGHDCVIHFATFPGLAPVVDPASITGHGFLDEAGLKRALCAAESRDGVGEALLAYAAQFLTRLCLFSVFHHVAHGWLVEGLGPVLEDVHSFEVDLNQPSILAAANEGVVHEGPVPPGEVDRNIAACLGDPVPEDLVVIPVRVQDRTVAFLMGDIPGQSTIGVPIRELTEAAQVTGLALEMIILRRKISRVLGA